MGDKATRGPKAPSEECKESDEGRMKVGTETKPLQDERRLATLIPERENHRIRLLRQLLDTPQRAKDKQQTQSHERRRKQLTRSYTRTYGCPTQTRKPPFGLLLCEKQLQETVETQHVAQCRSAPPQQSVL